MRKILFTVLSCLISFSVYSQKVNIKVISHLPSVKPEWRILDENYHIVFAGSDFFKEDTVVFGLENNTRFYFVVSFYKEIKDTRLFTLYIGNEPVILVGTDIGPGDHFIPFFTGVKVPETKITGGTNTTISEFPWQVLISTGSLMCGGTIISNNWILTAAHCTRQGSGTVSASQVLVTVGATNPFNPLQGTTYHVSEVIPHENFNNNTLLNDLALLKLSTPIDNPNAAPIRLVNSTDVKYGATDPGVMGWVTGWGLTNAENENSFPTILQKVQLPVITNKQASTVWTFIPSTDLMAGYLNGNKDACNGDSGGPFVVPVMGEYRLAGIVSWGSSTCDTYGAYTRVSLFQEWIRSRTGIAPGALPAAPAGDTVICSGTTSSPYTVPVTPGGSGIQWRISPSDAGTVSGSASSATVSWNPGFTGTAILGYRTTISGTLSEWSRLRLHRTTATNVLRLQADTAVCAAQPVTLRILTEGYGLTYNWFRNGVPASTTTVSQLTIPSTTPADAGNYTVTVTGQCGTVTSGIMHLTVYTLTGINSVSADTSLAFGADLSLNVNAEGNNLTYTWKKENTVLQTSASPLLLVESVNANDIGQYTVTVKGTCGYTVSDSIYVFVKGSSYPAGPDLFLWPSVTRDIFNVATLSEDQYNVYIYNTMGQRMLEYRYLSHQSAINISMLPQGTYIVTVFNKNFRRSLRVIKI
ncbi:MAG TPA: trypsin-like serine protease [Bacteroidales bacterium]|nr:trypsin-like serine protease [Bacteroidales bacterium]